MKKLLSVILLLSFAVSASSQTLKTIMESNKFVVAPPNFWTQQVYDAKFSNAVNAVVVHPETGNTFNTNQFITNGGIVSISTNVFPTFGQFNTNYFTTNSSIIGLNTNFTSLTYHFVTNLIAINALHVAAGSNIVIITNANLLTIHATASASESFWGTNAASGGITNVFDANYNKVWVQKGELWVGTNADIGNLPYVMILDAAAADDRIIVNPGRSDQMSVTDSGSIEGGLFWIENFPGFSGQASFGSALPYATNAFQVVLNTNGVPAFEVNEPGAPGGGVVHIRNPLTVGGVQTNTSLAGSGTRFVGVDDNGKLVVTFGTNFVTGGSGSVLEYTTTDPTTDNVFPTVSNSPAIAYKRGGIGTTWSWNTSTHVWQ